MAETLGSSVVQSYMLKRARSSFWWSREVTMSDRVRELLGGQQQRGSRPMECHQSGSHKSAVLRTSIQLEKVI